MFRVYFINFDYYAQEEGKTVEEAKEIARRAGFQSRVEGPNGPVGSWCPLAGWREMR